MLQTRNGKRTAAAAVKIAVDLVKEGLISKEEALLKVVPSQLDALLHPTFVQEALDKAKPVAKDFLLLQVLPLVLYTLQPLLQRLQSMPVKRLY